MDPVAEAIKRLAWLKPQPSHTVGLIEPGNIDLKAQPRVKNPDGTISTVRSISVNVDGREVLIPTVSFEQQRVLSDEEAVQEYYRTGRHLGKFASPEAATNYASRLHEDYAAGMYDK